jgi:hypothetical protein
MQNLDLFKRVTSPRFSMLCCLMAFGSCTRDDSIGNNTKRDASPTPDTKPMPDVLPTPPDLVVPNPDLGPAPDTTWLPPADAWSCSAPPRVDDAGVSQWSWYFHWASSAETCASYGAVAKMVLEIDFPTDPQPSRALPDCTTDEVRNGTTRACMIAGAYRYEIDCNAGELYFDLPSPNTIHGWYHMEGARVTKIQRYIISQGVECSRMIGVVGFGPLPAPDGGTDALDATDACKVEYLEPGCGAAAKPVCHQSGEPIPLIGVYYCGCDGKTLMGSVVAADQPFQFKGCCPGDTGFGPLGSYSCPWDGGLPYPTSREDAAVATGDTPPGPDGSDSSGSSTWIDRTAGTAAGSLPWVDVASDASGIHLVAVTGLSGPYPDGNIWTSADLGVTWTNRTKGTQASGQRWKSVASDASGARLVAVTQFTGLIPGGEDVWTSTDGGATWTRRTTVSSTARAVVGPTVVSDSTGAHLVLADGDIWASDDGGATWTDRTAGTSMAAQPWADLASDATAAHLVGITAMGDIWTSADAGATWANRTQGTAASGQDWQSVASDATGTRLVAGCAPSTTSDGIRQGGDIWTSPDGGAAWTNHTTGTVASGLPWLAVASDASGTNLVAASAHGSVNEIWMSTDFGTSWTNVTAGTAASGQQWAAVASDATGVHLVAVSSDPPGAGICCIGDIWTK